VLKVYLAVHGSGYEYFEVMRCIEIIGHGVDGQNDQYQHQGGGICFFHGDALTGQDVEMHPLLLPESMSEVGRRSELPMVKITAAVSLMVLPMLQHDGR